MKTGVRIFATAGLLALLATPAVRANGGDLRPRIPFDFTVVGGTTLTAGAYTVSRSGVFSGFLGIRNRQGSVSLLIPTPSSGREDRAPKLVFHRYGNRYFLRAVYFGDRYGYDLPATVEEREASRMIARQTTTPEVVSVQASRLDRE
jgi:hypothetical protein